MLLYLLDISGSPTGWGEIPPVSDGGWRRWTELPLPLRVELHGYKYVGIWTTRSVTSLVQAHLDSAAKARGEWLVERGTPITWEMEEGIPQRERVEREVYRGCEKTFEKSCGPWDPGGEK
ncbi:hypothetical protein NDU88_000234 [Pleurodeles waltl]|uniref:Uncharacterized protein n=1 Tax=Pleurodeles waltl TaxID=8319 RepID=A0AAV7MGV1_PLEWA|nr:hypothetical protein NDU88_000234 [Pleurodeles waltl]